MPETNADPLPPEVPAQQEQAQLPPKPVVPQSIESTLAKERMVTIIKVAKQNEADAQMILDALNANPALDAAVCRICGIKPLGPTQ